MYVMARMHCVFPLTVFLTITVIVRARGNTFATVSCRRLRRSSSTGPPRSIGPAAFSFASSRPQYRNTRSLPKKEGTQWRYSEHISTLLVVAARGSRTFSEEDLFEDDSFYGGKTYGRGRSGTRSKRDKKNEAAINNDQEDAAWDQFYGSATTVVDSNDDEAAPSASLFSSSSNSFPERTEEAIDTLRKSALSFVSEQKWKPDQLDAEKDDLPTSSPWRRYQAELKAAVDLVSRNLVERSEESRLVVLGMVAGEHVLLIGKPGTGKSVLGRRLSQLCGGQFFQRLLTRFTTPEEIFGPLSLKGLENDEYKRCTSGYLPTASIGFLDELFKCNSAILNTLLTILNERKFDNGAGVREDCPLRCVVGASNELPEDEELDALYDRFLIRKEVKPVSDDGLTQLLSAVSTSVDETSSGNIGEGEIEGGKVFADGLDEVASCLAKAAMTVAVPDDICTILRNLRTYMREELDVEVSDRRLVQAARLLRLSAASHGRILVDPIDLLLLQHIIWRNPEQRAAVRQWLWANLTPGGEGSDSDIMQYRFLLDGLKQSAEVAVRSTAGDVTGSGGARPSDVAAIAALKEQLSHLSSLLQHRLDSLARHSELLHRATLHCWVDEDEAKAAQQLLLPKAEQSIEAVSQTLLDARILHLALSGDSSAPDNDIRLSVIESLWEVGKEEASFSEDELELNMKDAKKRWKNDSETFRAWKRARKKMKRRE